VTPDPAARRGRDTFRHCCPGYCRKQRTPPVPGDWRGPSYRIGAPGFEPGTSCSRSLGQGVLPPTTCRNLLVWAGVPPTSQPRKIGLSRPETVAETVSRPRNSKMANRKHGHKDGQHHWPSYNYERYLSLESVWSKVANFSGMESCDICPEQRPRRYSTHAATTLLCPSPDARHGGGP